MRLESSRIGKLFQPNIIAVFGASEKRQTRGNVVIQNLKHWKFPGRIIPVHPTAGEIEGLAAVSRVDELPPETDVAFISVPASGVSTLIRQLDVLGVGSAVVITNGFLRSEETELREVAHSSDLLMHGPNCMGVINVSDQIPLYTARISQKVKAGNVALLAQSGSAAVAVLNSLDVGFSKVVTLGSEFRLSSSGYLNWLADDPKTSVVGLIVESIQSPATFADAAETVRRAGKRLVALKVGRSAEGALATQAHTGALISGNDAYECFFRDLGIPTTADYDEFVAALECLSVVKEKAVGTHIAVVGISGGQTALACDVAAEVGIPLAQWSAQTAVTVTEKMPGTTGKNPLDLWSAINVSADAEFDAVHAIAADPSVGLMAFIQDAQASLPEQLLGRYRATIDLMAKLSGQTSKPIVMISPTGEPTHEKLTADLDNKGIPVLRGLRPGLIAARALMISGTSVFRKSFANVSASAAGADLMREVRAVTGPLPSELCKRLLAAYDIPVVGSRHVRSSRDPGIEEIETFPVVVKILSPNIAHRSDIGGVRTGLKNLSDLKAGLESISQSVSVARPEAVIDGFEIQDDLTGCVEVMVGFTAAPPFGAITVVGSGGVLVELHDDRAVGLGVITSSEALNMIAETTPGKMLSGYRKLLPNTNLQPLANLICNLSRLAADYDGVISECDLNPVMVYPGSGEVRAVDILLVAKKAAT